MTDASKARHQHSAEARATFTQLVKLEWEWAELRAEAMKHLPKEERKKKRKLYTEEQRAQEALAEAFVRRELEDLPPAQLVSLKVHGAWEPICTSARPGKTVLVGLKKGSLEQLILRTEGYGESQRTTSISEFSAKYRPAGELNARCQELRLRIAKARSELPPPSPAVVPVPPATEATLTLHANLHRRTGQLSDRLIARLDEQERVINDMLAGSITMSPLKTDPAIEADNRLITQQLKEAKS